MLVNYNFIFFILHYNFKTSFGIRETRKHILIRDTEVIYRNQET